MTERPDAYPAIILDPATTIPLPTEDDWRAAIQADPDTRCVYRALRYNAPLHHGQLTNKIYYELYHTNHFDLHNGILYFYEEPHRARAHHLRTRVVPT